MPVAPALRSGRAKIPPPHPIPMLPKISAFPTFRPARFARRTLPRLPIRISALRRSRGAPSPGATSFYKAPSISRPRSPQNPPTHPHPSTSRRARPKSSLSGLRGCDIVLPRSFDIVAFACSINSKIPSQIRSAVYQWPAQVFQSAAAHVPFSLHPDPAFTFPPQWCARAWLQSAPK